MQCPACGRSMMPRLKDWIYCCSDCGLWRSTLKPYGGTTQKPRLDETRRRVGIETLRRHNFNRILNLLEEVAPSPQTVLDVGCGHGWFLREAGKRGYEARGLEPDPEIAAEAKSLGLDVIQGFFPEDLDPGLQVQVITFNDVFEHLENPEEVLKICYQRLAPHGKLVLCLPSSEGLVFRVGCGLARLKLDGVLERLWQKDFPSPHLFYYNRDNLLRLCIAQGFRRIASRRLLTVSLRGLWARLRMDPLISPAAAVFRYAAVLLAYPWLNHVGPSDIQLHIFERRPAP